MFFTLSLKDVCMLVKRFMICPDGCGNQKYNTHRAENILALWKKNKNPFWLSGLIFLFSSFLLFKT